VELVGELTTGGIVCWAWMLGQDCFGGGGLTVSRWVA
jgi:hypothetical protein